MPSLRTVLTVALLLLLFTATVAHAQTFSVVYNFGTNFGDPETPVNPGVISQGLDGRLYSSTAYGGEDTYIYSLPRWGKVANPTPGVPWNPDAPYWESLIYTHKGTD